MTRAQMFVVAGVVLLIALAAALWISSGSRSGSASVDTVAAQRQAAEESEQTFRYAINLLLRHEDFDAATTFGEALQRLNQWVRHQPPDDQWALDPLVSGLPLRLLEIEPMRGLADLKFQDFDRAHLQEAVWMRDAAEAARGKSLDPITRATNLFDWVVRNIQLEGPAAPGGDLTAGVETQLPRLPGETLLYGRGLAVDRAWIFMLMARQQHLEVVLLAFADPETANGSRTWAPALLHQGELYVFEPTLGMPIPGPGGQGVATLTQLRADDALLRQLDVDEQHRYPVTSAQLETVAALIEASPGYLTRRMRLVQSRLAADQAFVLSASPQHIAAQLRDVPGVADAIVWGYPQFTYLRVAASAPVSPEAIARAQRDIAPFEANKLPPKPPGLRLASMAMQRGRVLQLKGRHEGPEGAGVFYKEARLPDAEIDAAGVTPEQKRMLNEIKQNASFWMGLLSEDYARWESAADYFENRVLKPYPDSIWAAGARYNLGRSYEALGKIDEAVAAFEGPADSPYWWGNQLRIRRLRPPEAEPAAPAAEPTQQTPPTPPLEAAPSESPAQEAEPSSPPPSAS